MAISIWLNPYIVQAIDMSMNILQRIIGRADRILKHLNLRTKANNKIRKSNWYYNQFPHLREFERLERNADIICIGSTPAKNAIDFDTVSNVKGYNLAICPETIFYDFQVLKNYHSYLRDGGTVLFVLCPFTFLKDFYRNEFGSQSYLNIRYYPVLHRAMIDNFDYKLYHKWVEEPLLIGKDAWKRLIKDRTQSRAMCHETNPDTEEQSKQLCRERVKNWMREFQMTDLIPEHIPQRTEAAIQGNIKIFKQMKAFVEERGYHPVIVIPPFPSEMTELLPENLVEHTLFEPVKQTGIPYISYYGKEEWLSRDLYYHGFLLNATGRKKLTINIITRLQLA